MHALYGDAEGMERTERPMKRMIFALVVTSAIASSAMTAGVEISAEKAASALRQGVEYFRTRVSVGGGYLWRYAADFSQREGETPASPTTVWVQPPGTPSVGMGFLGAHELTGDPACLEAARETAMALVRGQLESGGWDYRIEFAAADRRKYAYRVDGASRASGRNVTTLDDNTTQAALSCLMRVDHALNFEDVAIHEAAGFALGALLAAQYPNGAWPQRFSAPPDRTQFPVKKASYPDAWPAEYPKKDYRSYYTFNDNTMADTIELMFLAAEIYEEDKYAAAGKRGGEFILRAQMPEPQPGWAQQYNAAMHPAWARKFEPPAITGAESQGVMTALLRLFELTGERQFLEPLPRALAYFRRSRLEDDRLARFYELRTNRPLYFTMTYRLTYSDADLPTHYGFKSGNRLEHIAAKFESLLASADSEKSRARAFSRQRAPAMSTDLATRAARIVEAQDDRGAWVEPAPSRVRSKIPVSTPSLACSTFVSNIVTLARYIAASR